jgi:hypothetical protein
VVVEVEAARFSRDWGFKFLKIIYKFRFFFFFFWGDLEEIG